MPKIPIYNPDGLANRVVGTPGIDPSAGDAEKALAAGAQSAANQLGDLAYQQAGMAGHLLGKIGQALGQKMAQHRAATAAQKQMVADVASTEYDQAFRGTVDSTLDGFKKKYISNPQDAPAAFDAFLKSSRETTVEAAKSDGRFSDAPYAVDKLNGKFGEKALTATNQMRDWADGQAARIAVDAGKRVNRTGVYDIAQLTGTVSERIEGFNRIKERGLLAHDGQVSALGQWNVDDNKEQGERMWANALFDNLLAVRPEAAREALPHLSEAKALLARDGAKTGLNGDEIIKLRGQISTAEDHEINELQLEEMMRQQGEKLNVSTIRMGLDAGRNNIQLQEEGIKYAVDRAVEIGEEWKAVAADPRLSDKAKLTIQKTLLQQMDMLDTHVVGVAHKNLRYNETQANEAAREFRRVQNEIERDAKTELKEQAREAKAALKLSKDEAIFQRNELQRELSDMLARPLDHREEIPAKAAELADFTRAAREAGHLTPEQAARGERIANKAIEKAARFKSGWWGKVQVMSPKKNQAEIQEQQTKYLNEMHKIQQELESVRVIEKSTNDLPAQGQDYVRSEYQKGVDANPNMTPEQKRLALQGVISVARRKYSNAPTPPPTVQQMLGGSTAMPKSNKMVAPPAADVKGIGREFMEGVGL